MSNRLDALQQKIIELQEELASLRRSEYIARAGTARALDTQFPGALLHLPFDGGAPYERDFSVNLYGHKLQRPTVASGGIIGRPGKFGKAVQLAEGTTNLVVQHPVFDSLSGWGTRGSPSVKELSTAWVAYDQYSCHIVGTDLGHGALSGIGTLTSGVTYTASADVKVVSGTARLQIYQDGSPFTSYGYLDVPAPYEGRVSFTFTMPATVACRVAVNNNGEGFWDGIQVEQKAYPTPFCYGDMGPGHAWTGTAHASTSTRVAAYLRYAAADNSVDNEGTFSAWVWIEAMPDAYSYVIRRTGESLTYIIFRVTDVGQLSAYWGDATYSGGSVPFREWAHVVITRTAAGTLTGYVNGEQVFSGPTNAFVPSTTYPGITLGRRDNSDVSPLNGYLDDLLILDRALTPTEVKRLYEAGQAGCPVVVQNTVPGDWKPIAVAQAGSAQTVPHGVRTIINYNTILEDTVGGVTTGTDWAYTVRRAGDYRLSASVMMATDGALADNEVLSIEAYVNDSRLATLDYARNVPPGAAYAFVAGQTIAHCAVGDVIDFRLWQESGASRSIYGSPTRNIMTIEWIG